MDALYAWVSAFRAPLAAAALLLFLIWETAAPWFLEFNRKPARRARHALRNLGLGLLNSAVVAAAFVALWAVVTTWTARQQVGLLHWMALPLVPRGILAIILLDLWTYWWHRINHEIPFLWRFHRVHHSDPRMDVTTANRFHTGEIVLSSLLRVPVLIATGATLGELALYEGLLLAVTQFHHANIGFSERFDRMLRLIIPSPAMHKVHHSREIAETNSNYGSLFCWWDRLFRSFRLNPDPHSIQFGLHGHDDHRRQRFTGLLREPWRDPEKGPSSDD